MHTGGCSYNNTLEGLSSGILNENDPQLVSEGLPSYLLVLDGLLEGDPDNVHLLLSASRLYGAYASTFVSEPERARKLASKARDYAHHALCLKLEKICAVLAAPVPSLEMALNDNKGDHLDILYGFDVAWVTWIQQNSQDWGAIADLPKTEAIFRHIIRFDPAYDHGNVQLYMAVLSSQRPAALGGKPEAGRAYFEKAIEYSDGKNLMAKVLFAQYYARLVFNRPLHDQLLRDVLNTPARSPGLTLINTLAKQQAKQLLESADDYF
ncbi:MAG: hypothetical protein D6698_00535 [Gammaproteobacteria bacterium]|nr:MAG: hypothetical protein D6698_00535 [Gammaproteobacteria bacterium]